MKKLLLLTTLILSLVLAACSGPILQTSPSLNVNPTPTTQESTLNRASDYAALIKLVREAQANLNQYPNRLYFAAKSGTATMAESRDAAGQNAAGSSTDYSRTNIQVEGVDEADIIKTDGSYLYLVANNRLYIVDARDPAKMKVMANIPFAASQETDKIVTGENPVEMYLDVENQRLTLIINGWLYEKAPAVIPQPNDTKPVETKPAETGSTGNSGNTGTGSASAGTANAELAPDQTSPADSGGTKTDVAASGVSSKMASIMMPRYNNNKQYTTTRIYNISDKAAPKLMRQFTQEGYYLSSRKIDAAVYVVSNQYKYQIYLDDKTEPKPADIFPATRDSLEPVTKEGWNTVSADRISILPNGDISSQLILSAIDTLKNDSKPDILSVLGSSGTIYASRQFLYIAGYNYQWDGKETSAPVYSTDIYRFRLAAAKISEAGKGSVPGSIINQFSMDEHQGNFRIATTTGESWTRDGANVAKNNVYVLDASLKLLGSVTGLAPGETIKSVRFMGDKVYVVTFRNVDPLFVIDLSNPAKPQVLGQLKIPGYSTYLHPYADNMLLGFGYDVRNEGSNAYNMGLKVSLFDISDFTNPRELSTILLGGRGSYAEILNNHKTLLFSKEKNLIAFPAQLTKTITSSPLEYGQPIFQGLLVLAVDSSNQLTLRGQITHFDKLSDPNGKPVPLTEAENQAFYGYDAVSRGAWIGDILYTFSARQVRSANLVSLGKIGAVELPGYKDSQNVYYGMDIAVR